MTLAPSYTAAVIERTLPSTVRLSAGEPSEVDGGLPDAEEGVAQLAVADALGANDAFVHGRSPLAPTTCAPAVIIRCDSADECSLLRDSANGEICAPLRVAAHGMSSADAQAEAISGTELRADLAAIERVKRPRPCPTASPPTPTPANT